MARAVMICSFIVFLPTWTPKPLERLTMAFAACGLAFAASAKPQAANAIVNRSRGFGVQVGRKTMNEQIITARAMLASVAALFLLLLNQAGAGANQPPRSPV